MNHDQFVEGVMRNAGLTKANVNRFYAGLLELARRELARNKHFVLPGLGSLRVRVRKARTGRNPRSGELMRIPARRVVRFRAFGSLRDMVNAAGETAPSDEAASQSTSSTT